jgi:hypothetical protein
MARPKGSHNVKEVQHLEPTRCSDCGSTATKVLNTDVQEFGGTTEDGERINFDGKGKPFNRIVRRRTQCESCARVWIVHSLEFEPPKPAEQAPADTSGTESPDR